jgi:hypothetical protein
MKLSDLPKRRAIAKFDTVGDRVAGEVLAPGPEWQADKFNPDGEVLVFTLGTADGEVQLFARKRQLEAIHEAAELAGADEILTGGWLELEYSGEVEVGSGTAKCWDAAYRSPDDPIGVGELVDAPA